MTNMAVDDQGHCLLSGDINLKTVMAVYTNSLASFAGKEKVVVDFSIMVTFDSAVISLMLSWLRHAKQQGRQQILFKNIPEKLHYLIEAYKLTPVMSFACDETSS